MNWKICLAMGKTNRVFNVPRLHGIHQSEIESRVGN